METAQTNEIITEAQTESTAPSDDVQRNDEQTSEGTKESQEAVIKDDNTLCDEAESKIAEAISSELAKINAIDPDIKSFDDILNSDTGKAFTEKVRRGYSLYDAYLVTNQKRILRSVSESAHQSAINSVNSKSHLTGNGVSKAEAPIDVPSKTYFLYKSMFPQLSDQQIKAHYAKHNRSRN